MKTNSDHDSLYRIAETQAGYFTSEQARSVGFTPSLLAYHAQVRQFERIERGLYRLIRFPATPHEDLFVASLSAGPHAVISHDSALAFYELSDLMPSEIHLTVPRTSSRRHPGLRFHTNRLEESEVSRYNGLRVTTVPRTIADVAAGGLADELLIQAIHQSLQRGLTTLKKLQDVKGRGRKRVAHLIAKYIQNEETEI